MRAAHIERFGGPEVVQVVDLPAAGVGPGQVMVDVVGSSINPADIAVRSGWMSQFLPLEPPLTLGTDIAGIVAGLGDGVVNVAVGDSVYGVAGVVMGGSGGFAEQAVTTAGQLATVPAGIDLVTAGALPLAGIAALEAITERLGVEAGSRVLVHGASGGVGLFAVALAVHLEGQVVASVRTERVALMHQIGVDDVVDGETTDLLSLEPFDLVLDLVGADPILPVQLTRPGGRAVGLRIMPDQEAAAAKGVEVALQATAVTTERLDRFRDYVDQQVVRAYIAHTFELSDVSKAFTVKETVGAPGKIAIAVQRGM
jgi:NADPH:quinone reductase-like Zn-dependent oxidoreductase